MIYLDTHIVVWLYSGELKPISAETIELMNQSELIISPIVQLELQYLYEIGRIKKQAEEIISDLDKRIGLQISNTPFASVILSALKLNWTRDPFDRLIVAEAAHHQNVLVSLDKHIQGNYPHVRQ